MATYNMERGRIHKMILQDNRKNMIENMILVAVSAWQRPKMATALLNETKIPVPQYPFQVSVTDLNSVENVWRELSEDQTDFIRFIYVYRIMTVPDYLV